MKPLQLQITDPEAFGKFMGYPENPSEESLQRARQNIAVQVQQLVREDIPEDDFSLEAVNAVIAEVWKDHGGKIPGITVVEFSETE